MSDTVSKEWYVIHTYSGYENKVKDNIEKRVESLGMEDKIFRIVVPEEKETILTPTGKKKEVNRKTFPGYVLVELVMTDDSWFVVRNTPGVTGFVGVGSDPIPLSDEEAENLLAKVNSDEKERLHIDFEIGENVVVKNDSFMNQVGEIVGIDYEHGKITLLLEVFGRQTPVQVDYTEISKTEY